jgi:di/tricarboxylate transporter
LSQVCIAFAFAVSTAMEKSGLAQTIAGVFVALSELLMAVPLVCAGCWLKQYQLQAAHPGAAFAR